MPDEPHFQVKPQFRCYGRRKEHPGRPCGAPASWMRAGVNGSEPSFFCDVCKGVSDVPIAGDVRFRRVTVTCDLILAATSLVPGSAHAEAVARLEELAGQVGGLVNLHSVTSTVGRYSPPGSIERRKAPRGNQG